MAGLIPGFSTKCRRRSDRWGTLFGTKRHRKIASFIVGDYIAQ
jgi:hypothetical protein